MNIISIAEFPIDGAIDCGCSGGDSVDVNDNDSVLTCNNCQTELLNQYYLYQFDQIESRYLCLDCENLDLGICHYRLKFYPADQLFELTDNITVHRDETEIIETYQNIKNKSNYLKMMNIEPVDYSEVDLTTETISEEAKALDLVD